jgi:DNA-binding transcriptional ArsR family regulator
MSEHMNQEPKRSDVDRIIHEPARLRIMMVLFGVDEVDFNFLLSTLGLTKGNLSSHMERLEQAEYVHIQKGFAGKVTNTRYRLTPSGQAALVQYWKDLDDIRGMEGRIPLRPLPK